MEFSLPKNITAIISKLNDNGYTAHVVGGCVRDMVLKKEPKDWDITTNALPDDVKQIFPKTYDTGIKHGTVTVVFEGMAVEITTWRRDMDYSDHRRPDKVQFSQTLTEDLMRRDFTMNALAYHPYEGLIDPFNGLSDIEAGLIRCVGKPLERFSEDALRMLRAIRFSAQLGFTVEPDTLQAIKTHHEDLKYVSRERIASELNKMLASRYPERLSLLWETGLGRGIFPSIQTLPPRFPEACKALTAMTENAALFNEGQKRILLLGLLFVLAFKENAHHHALSLLKDLKYDNATLDGVRKLILAVRDLSNPSARNIRRALWVYGREAVQQALMLLKVISSNMLSVTDPSCLPKPLVPALTGGALLKTGEFKGPEIGRTMELLNFCLWERPELNDAQTLILLAQSLKRMVYRPSDE